MENTEKQIQENKMGVMPVNKLLVTMSLPMVISMFVQALYNIVDSIFVAQISENALTAVSLAFPMQMLTFAFAVGTAVGTNAILARSLGEKNFKNVNRSAVNGIFIQVLFCIIFMIIGATLSRPFYTVQVGQSEITEMGVQYLSIAMVASLGMFMEVMFERLLQATGKTIYTMITQGVGAVFNIIFDPILIFGLLGAPKMGVAGAALATVGGQFLAAIMACIFCIKKNHEVNMSFRKFRPDFHMIGRILAIGIPTTVMQAISSVMVFLMNKILIKFTSTAVAVFGVYFKLNSFAFMPLFGLNNGMIPIVAYNYGAAKKERLMKTIKLCLIYAELFMLAGTIVFQLIPDKLLMLFNASENMIAIGSTALRIISFSFMFAGVCIVFSSVFQALGHGVISMIVSIMRQLVVLIPSAYLLSLLGNVNYVWWSYDIAEIVSITLSILFFKFRIYDKIIVKIGANEKTAEPEE